MPSYTLGEEVLSGGKRFRVVRIITDSRTLCRNGEHDIEIRESYVQLRGEDGSPDFIVLEEDVFPYTGPSSKILPLRVPPRRPE